MMKCKDYEGEFPCKVCDERDTCAAFSYFWKMMSPFAKRVFKALYGKAGDDE